MRNCTRDEGGPFGFGNQVLIPSHRGPKKAAIAVAASLLTAVYHMLKTRP
jgi:hypothetical protein